LTAVGWFDGRQDTPHADFGASRHYGPVERVARSIKSTYLAKKPLLHRNGFVEAGGEGPEVAAG
jgi:hypothetical protein